MENNNHSDVNFQIDSNTQFLIKPAVELSIFTLQAKNLLTGRNPTNGKNIIVGIKGFAKLTGIIYTQSEHDDPFADLALIKIESKMEEALDYVEKRERFYQHIFDTSQQQTNKDYSDSRTHWNIQLGFSHPYGYKLADVIGKYDGLLCLMLACKQKGLLENKNLVSKDSYIIKKYVRSVTGIAMHWKNFSVTREQIRKNTHQGLQALQFYSHHYSQRQINSALNRTIFPKYGPRPG